MDERVVSRWRMTKALVEGSMHVQVDCTIGTVLRRQGVLQSQRLLFNSHASKPSIKLVLSIYSI